jgi:outer membrane protein assembly factor BamB
MTTTTRRSDLARLGRALIVGIAVWLTLAGVPDAADWPQWGGPDRNFRVAAVPLASEWPASGPKTIWRRPLGHGDSAIVTDSDRLYTIYRRVGREAGREVIVALDRATGETRWEHDYAAPLWEGMRSNMGEGPRATPIVVGDRVCATGVAARLTCLDTKSGRVLWSRDLWEHFDVDPSKYGPSDRGFGASPLAIGDRLVTVAGGPGHAVTALDLADGSVVWASLDYEIGYASPILIDVEGEKQLVFFLADRVVGVSPEDGAFRWEHPHVTDYSVNATTPLWGPGGVLFVSSAYDAGSRGLRLTRGDGTTEVEELWQNRKMQIMHGTAVGVGDVIWGSSGHRGPAFLVGVRAATGEEVARMRGFAKANIVASGDRLVLLDEEGVLGLVSIEGNRPVILAKAELLTRRAWAAPTLVGATLYARDRKEIVAVDLGP